jgi:hypothetical protein
MNTNPQVAGSILRLFTIAAVVGVSGVFAADQVISIASRKRMAEAGRAELRAYNAEARPEQDRLYDRPISYFLMSSFFLRNDTGTDLMFQRYNLRSNEAVE